MTMQLCPPEHCTGCGVCAAVCAQQCIAMRADARGFLHPEIDADRCLGCGVCRDTCPVLHPSPVSEAPPKAFVARSQGSREGSSSGGVFPILAGAVIRRGGVVWGAAWEKDLRSVKHQPADSEQALGALCGSKYLPSDCSQAYQQIRAQLEAGKTVYFSGTPCQAAGLRAVLGGGHPRLIIQSIVCHGVPAPAVWNACLNEVEEKGDALERVDFRYRPGPFHEEQAKLKYASGAVRCTRKTEHPFFRGYIKNLYLRRACHACPFKGEKDAADLTLGDAWGAERDPAAPNDGLGLSAVLLRTERGTALWEAVSEQCVSAPWDLKALEHANPALCAPSPVSELSAPFWDRFSREPFGRLIDELCPRSGKERLKALVPQPIKRLLKRKKLPAAGSEKIAKGEES